MGEQFDELIVLDRPDLAATASPFDATVLECAMLWPADAVYRRRVLGRGFALDIRSQGGDATSEALRVALDLALAAPSAEEIASEVEARIWHGVIAGRILVRFAEQAHLPDLKRMTMERIISDVCDIQNASLRRGDGVGRHIRPSTANRYWKDYRRVAHFWAAREQLGFVVFPCEVSRLPELLAVSEWFRGVGLSLRPYGASNPLLVDPVAVPGAIHLPKINLEYNYP